MSLPLIPCPTCLCHAKRDETHCPSCGEALRRPDGTLPRAAVAVLFGLVAVTGEGCHHQPTVAVLYGIACGPGPHCVTDADCAKGEICFLGCNTCAPAAVGVGGAGGAGGQGGSASAGTGGAGVGGGLACVPAGDACSNSSECCNAFQCDNSLCCRPPGSTVCTASGAACSVDCVCCSGVCNTGGTCQ